MAEKGSRVIDLFMPFESDCGLIESVTLSPISWGQVLRWQKGEYAYGRQLLVELTGLSEEASLLLKYPDVDRVITAFIEHVPQEIRNSMSNGYVPFDYLPVAQPPEPIEEPQAAPELETTLPPNEFPETTQDQPIEEEVGFDVGDEHGR